MKCRPTDPIDGDMVPITETGQLLDGAQAVLAAVSSRLALLRGEWWEDTTLGFAVPSFLYDGVRMPEGSVMLTNYITAYIADTEGVQAVQNVTGQVIRGKLHYTCTIVTAYGNVEGSVSDDVLLLAIS